MQNSFQRQNSNRSLGRWLAAGFVLLVVGAALFPYGLIPFGRIFSIWPELGHGLYHVFASWPAHVAGHGLIFMVMGTAVLLRFPSLLQRPKVYLALMLLLGILQEFFQIVGFKHRALVFDDIFDVFVDVAGALIAFLLLRLLRNMSVSSFSPRTTTEVTS
jgi:glycopeptide antibiotics resistance protein